VFIEDQTQNSDPGRTSHTPCSLSRIFLQIIITKLTNHAFEDMNLNMICIKCLKKIKKQTKRKNLDFWGL